MSSDKTAPVATGTPDGNQLRERLRLALDRHIDPDDDTMPTIGRDGFVWVPADDVIEDLAKAVEQP